MTEPWGREQWREDFWRGVVPGYPVALTLPWPPSVNGCYRSVVKNGRAVSILSKKARVYRGRALDAIIEQGSPCIPGKPRVCITERFYPPDRRGRDIDNYRKAYRDALTHGRVWNDDKLVKHEQAFWMPLDRDNPRIEIEIRTIEPDTGGKDKA